MTALAPEVAVIGLAIGTVLALASYLLTNLSPGGMITPGWLAITVVSEPRQLIVIAVVVALSYFAATAIQRYMILYGKRLFASVVLIAVFIQLTISIFVSSQISILAVGDGFGTLGFIIPGLITYQMIRQPIIATLVSTGAVTALTTGILALGIVFGLVPVISDTGIGL